MKKIISILLILLMMPIVIAQDEEITEENVGTLPDSPFYGFKIGMEKLRLVFTFNQQAKAEKRLLQARHRLTEMEIMLQKNKLKYAEKAQQHHDKLLEKLENVEIQDPERAARIEGRLQQHQQKLEQIRERTENKLEITEQQRERIKTMLTKVDNKTQTARKQAITSITKNIEKLQTANKPNQQNAIQALTRVRTKLEEKVQTQLQKRQQIIGGTCATVSPDARDECCKRKGFDGWDEELSKCIGEQIQELTQTQTQTNTQQGKNT